MLTLNPLIEELLSRGFRKQVCQGLNTGTETSHHVQSLAAEGLESRYVSSSMSELGSGKMNLSPRSIVSVSEMLWLARCLETSLPQLWLMEDGTGLAQG